jgi:hypothetical protein
MAENDETSGKTQKAEEDDQDLTAADKPGRMGHLDFITALVLMLVCAVVIAAAFGYYVKSRKQFYASPGFMPVIIAGSLFLLALSLMRQSLKGSSVKERFNQVRQALPRGLKSGRFKNSMTGLVFFGLYIFVLMRFLPFWLASLILVFATLVYLKASKLILCAVISVLSIGGIVLLFQIIFHVPMP